MGAAATCLNPPRRGRSRKTASPSISDAGGQMPEDLVRAILLLLPVKTLIRFKSMHSSWCRLISDNYHHHHHRSSDSKMHYGLTLDRSPKLLPITSSAQDSTSDLTLPNFGSESSPNSKMLEIVGSCFGIYCVHNRYDAVLWNFSTRARKLLPPVEVEGEQLESQRLWHSGFGSTVSKEGCIDFKFGGFTMPTNIWPTDGICVYTYSSDTWKLMTPPEFAAAGIDLDVESAPAFVKGAFHWMARRRCRRYYILYFHLESEIFETIELPKAYPALCEDGSMRDRLTEIPFARMAHIDDKSLCFAVVFRIRDACVEIWVMREYGVESTWYRFSTIEDHKISRDCYVDGLLFGDFDENVLSCDGMRAFQNACGRCNGTPRIFRYEESLISLGGTSETASY